MTDTALRDGQGRMTRDRLQGYVDDLLSTHKSIREIEDDMMQFGLDRETASSMIRNAQDSQWLEEGGGGPALAQVGPKHMILGTLLMAGGGAATYASVYLAINFEAPLAFIFYGAIFAGAIDFIYGLIRFFDG